MRALHGQGTPREAAEARAACLFVLRADDFLVVGLFTACSRPSTPNPPGSSSPSPSRQPRTETTLPQRAVKTAHPPFASRAQEECPGATVGKAPVRESHFALELDCAKADPDACHVGVYRPPPGAAKRSLRPEGTPATTCARSSDYNITVRSERGTTRRNSAPSTSQSFLALRPDLGRRARTTSRRF